MRIPSQSTGVSRTAGVISAALRLGIVAAQATFYSRCVPDGNGGYREITCVQTRPYPEPEFDCKPSGNQCQVVSSGPCRCRRNVLVRAPSTGNTQTFTHSCFPFVSNPGGVGGDPRRRVLGL